MSPYIPTPKGRGFTATFGKIQNTANPVYLEYLNEKINELKNLHLKRNNREFYIMVFSDDAMSIVKDTNIIRNSLDGLTKEINMDKKIRILHKLSNKTLRM